MNCFDNKHWSIFLARGTFWWENHIHAGLGEITKSALQNAFRIVFWNIDKTSILFFYHAFHQCDFVMKFCMHNKHLWKYVTKKIRFFWIFFLLFLFYSFAPGCRNVLSLLNLQIWKIGIGKPVKLGWMIVCVSRSHTSYLQC